MRDGGEAHGGNGGGRCRFRVMQPLCSRSSLSIYPYLQMPVCDYFWQCLVAQIAQAWRRAEAEPAPGSHPRFGRALLLRQHRGAAAAAVKRMNRVLGCFYRDNSTRRARGENDAIADWEQENDPRAQPPGPGP